MGLSFPSKVIQGDWQAVSYTNQNYSIVRDKSGRQGQQYEIGILPQTTIAQQLTIYNIRNTPPHQIIAVYGSEVKDQFGLCSNSSSFRVITEHLCLRFSQPFQLNVQQMLFVLTQSIKGFSYLYSVVGCFHITSNMIGLTTEGEVKVWMHQNLGSNSPQYMRKSITSLKIDRYQSFNQQQVSMITEIFSIISKHATKFPVDKYLAPYQLKRYGFKNIKDLFKEVKQKYQIQTLKRIDIMKKKIIVGI